MQFQVIGVGRLMAETPEDPWIWEAKETAEQCSATTYPWQSELNWWLDGNWKPRVMHEVNQASDFRVQLIFFKPRISWVRVVEPYWRDMGTGILFATPSPTATGGILGVFFEYDNKSPGCAGYNQHVHALSARRTHIWFSKGLIPWVHFTDPTRKIIPTWHPMDPIKNRSGLLST